MPLRDAFRIEGASRPRSTLLAEQQPSLIVPGSRVQRSRRKGSVMPEGAIYVGRPTMWGNPFQARGEWKHAKSVILHDRWLQGRLGGLSLERLGFCPSEIEALLRLRERVLTQIHTLAGKMLACWCPTTSKWCHAETLLRMAAIHAEYERFAA